MVNTNILLFFALNLSLRRPKSLYSATSLKWHPLETPTTSNDDLELSDLPTIPSHSIASHSIPALNSIRITSQRERSSLHFISEDAGVDRGPVVHEDSILGLGSTEMSRRLASVYLIHLQTISTAREMK
ncbi:hypothetical protein CEXT_295671 [Caerostris extrusa]|uniref:Uncharacterized protein n=1 Tax=Caerostris extrusa TaxID=172846 RepID=A0AAV4M6H9_CAEEX|nr:hypothetical protein CEXT_295671 [Caerostris extrusa]